MIFPLRKTRAQSSGNRTLPEMLAAYERVLIIQALSKGSRTKAAEILGISRVYLWKRMRRLEIDAALFPRARTGRKKGVNAPQKEKSKLVT